MTEEDKGTAVARRSPEDRLEESVMAVEDSRLRLEAYRIRTEVQRRKMIQEAAAEIAKSTWGRDLSPAASIGLARWCYGHGLDPIRHIFILGGRVYDACEYYRDRLAADPNYAGHEEQMIAPLVTLEEYTKGVDLSEELLGQIRAEVQQENFKRLQLAIKYGVPPEIFSFPKSAAAFLVRLRFKDGAVAEGVNWAGSRGRTKGQHGGAYDPVGDLEPVKTARTRAYRVAAKDRVPFTFKRSGPDRDDELIRVEDLSRQAIEIGQEQPPEALPGPQTVQEGLQIGPGSGRAVDVPEDPYAGEETERAFERELVRAEREKK